MSFVDIVFLVFQAMGSFCQIRLCEEARPALTEKVIHCGSHKREVDGMRR